MIRGIRFVCSAVAYGYEVHTASAPEWVRSPWFLLTPPECPEESIPRPQIDALLDEAVLRSAVTLVTAPAGSGKSHALAQWVRSSGTTFAWLTLTRYDTTPSRILRGLISTLQYSTLMWDRSSVQELATLNPDLADPAVAFETLWRFFDTLDEPVVVIIDDAHIAGPALADSVVADLLACPPRSLRLVLAGRGPLLPPLAPPHPQGVPSIVGSADLNFRETEIAALRAATPTGRQAMAAAKILDATGGWPLAVRLVLNRAPSAIPDAAFVPSPDGTFELTDYVAEHVLGSVRPELADFILATTASSRFDEALADRLSGRSDARLLLQECITSGLFLDRYTDSHNRSIYRWHSVFAGHCRIILRRNDTAHADRLCLIAADYIQSQFPMEAVTLALRGHDPHFATKIIENHWLDLVISSQADALEIQCISLPSPWRESAMIRVVRACCRDLLGDRAGASMLFDQARAAMTGQPAEKMSLVLAVAISELVLADDHTQLAAACDTVDRLLRGTHTLTPPVYSCAVFLLGWTELRLRRDTGRTIQLLRTAVRECQIAGQHTIAHRAAANLRFALAFSGDFNDAMAAVSDFTDATDRDHWDNYDGGIDLFAEGFVDYWRNDIAQSDKKFQQVIVSDNRQAPYADLARIFRALIACAAGRSDTLDVAERDLRSVSEVEAHGVPWGVYKQLALAKIAEARGHGDIAVDIAARISDARFVPVVSVILGELYRRRGESDLAVELVSPLTDDAAPSFVRVAAMVTLALVHVGSGKSVHAHQLLEQSLDIAEPQTILRPYVDGGQDLRDLLTTHSQWGSKYSEFLGAALASSSELSTRHHLSGQKLTRRELEVLNSLRTNMTIAEIAQALYVSVNTIKSQKRSLYRKLGVSTRRAAVAIRM